jgi:hypothetical protein
MAFIALPVRRISSRTRSVTFGSKIKVVLIACIVMLEAIDVKMQAEALSKS